MPNYRLMVSRVPVSQLARDRHTQTFYLQADWEPVLDEAPENLAQDAANLWAAHNVGLTGYTGFECRIYDLGDTEPREPKAIRFAAQSGASAPGPGEIALCLSYYAGRNVPRLRGRMYMGPFAAGSIAERPADGLMDDFTALATGIGNLGGVNVDWVQYSPTTGLFSKVTNAWVDDEWDTQRSRGAKPTKRLTVALDE
jgi:hypothetical protein